MPFDDNWEGPWIMRTSEQPFCTMLLWGGDCTDENEEFFWNALQSANWPPDALVAADDRAASSASASSSSHHRHHQQWSWSQHHHSHHHYLLCYQLHHLSLLRFIFHGTILVTIRRRALHLDLTVLSVYWLKDTNNLVTDEDGLLTQNSVSVALLAKYSSAYWHCLGKSGHPDGLLVTICSSIMKNQRQNHYQFMVMWLLWQTQWGLIFHVSSEDVNCDKKLKITKTMACLRL